ncbi:MAG: dual specificity protein phosphatase family protein [Burkholderiales bacterium]|nr:dual specificity protein phosphatase family protein [Burkholderiales bacterium]
MTGAPPVLQLDGFGVCFGRRVVLADVHLSLPAHGVDVLMGPVKTGKSTLLRSLAGLNDSSALYRHWGSVRLQGQPLAPGHRPALVQQHAAVLRAGVAEALWSQRRAAPGARRARTVDEAAQCLVEWGLGAVAPHAGGPVLDLPVVWQRAVNILSHALAQPALLCIDEPTFGLDEADAGRLVDWLRQLAERQRLWVALHHQGQARRLADRIVLLAGGRVLAHQDTAAFFTRPATAEVEQFVRTGSLHLPSPDAAPDDLSPDAPRPPPLPAAALQALAEFVGGDTRAAEPEAAPPSAGPAARDEAPDAPARASDAPPGAPAPREATARAPALQLPPRAPLPPLSAWGVEAAAKVGLVGTPGRHGPSGFEWILPGRLAGCPEPGVVSPIDYDLDLLGHAGITCLITLTEKDLPQEVLRRHGLINLHLPIYDREAPTLAQTYMLVRRMQLLMEDGHVLAVHCKAGIGRTGSILAAWLIREGGLSAATAIQRLRMIKPTYVQTELQERFLHEFEQDLLSRM